MEERFNRNDYHRYVHNLSGCEKKALKKIEARTEFWRIPSALSVQSLTNTSDSHSLPTSFADNKTLLFWLHVDKKWL